jgi:tetratricopeptide (TPR) repeat protein
LLEPISRTASIVEVGASFNPIAPKREGWDTKTIDAATRAELIDKYRGHPGVDTDRIEEVDFVWRAGPLSSAVPSALHGTFDAFIASHVIEHTPDLIAFLESAAKLLAGSGVVILAIPDKRFCFDYFRPLTMTGDVLSSHRARRIRHTKETLFDGSGYSVKADELIAWGQHSIDKFSFICSLEQAYSEFLTRGEDDDSPYTDAHAWQFTPSSFQLIILELARLGVTDWRVERIGSAVGCEFHAWLRRGGAESAAALTAPELDAKRLALLKHTLLEAKEQIEFMTTTQSSNTPEVVLALEEARSENATLRAEHTAAQSMLNEKLSRIILERDVLAAASTRWFEATIAVTADNNPLARAAAGRRSWWRKFTRRLIVNHRKLSPIALANRARDTRKWELAVRYYRDALEREPNEPRIWVECGHALKEAGKASEAEVAYRKALELDSQTAKKTRHSANTGLA